MSKSAQVETMNFKAESYVKKYQPHMELFEKSIIGQHVGRSASHITALGQMLDQWDFYKTKKEADGSLGTLGEVPSVAAGVITASFASNSLNVIANVQPLPEQSGVIYFEQTKSVSAKGNVATGKVTLSPNAAPEVYPQNYAGDAITLVIGQTVATTTAYTFPAAAKALPIRPRTVTLAIQLTAGTITCVDDGNGNLMGPAMGGTINYDNGNVVLNLYANPTEVKDISLGYGLDMEQAGTHEAEIEVELKSVAITAKTFALKAQLGIFKQFALENRFGINGKERLAVRLTQELNNELTNEAIAKIVANRPSVSIETWSKTPANTVPWVTHKLEFLDVITRAENKMLIAAGRGRISCIIAAPNVATILKTLPGFVASDIVGPGATIFGTINGITVVRAPQLAPTGNEDTANSAFCVYRGEEPFDGAAVYAPYMPIVSIEDCPVEGTTLMKRNGVAHMAAISVPSPNFIAEIKVTA